MSEPQGKYAEAEAAMQEAGWEHGSDADGNRYYFPPEDQDYGSAYVIPAEEASI